MFNSIHLIRLLFFLSIILSFNSSAEENIDPSKKAVSFNTRGRLGNRLTAYINCKWLCYKYNLPFLYIPFPYSDQFMLHEKESNLRSEWEKEFKNKVIIKNTSEIDTLPNSTLVILPYFREGPFANKWKILFYPNFHDPIFKKMMIEMLSPRLPVKTLNLKPNKINVALHVRTGGGIDHEKTKIGLIEKYPPDEFFIKSLKNLSFMFHNAPIYAHILTDDLHPERIARKYRKALKNKRNITIGYKTGGNNYPSNDVMEDFFSIRKFDCLIRGDSTFSITASLFHDFLAIVSLEKAHWSPEGKFIIDEVRYKINPSLIK